MRFPRFLPVLAASLVCQGADRPLPFSELVGKVQAQAQKVAGERKIRLGVAPFTAAGEQRFRDRGFGAFLTERLSAAMGSAGPNIRLFERGRLDAVLKEQKLSATGLFTESDAKRLGELVPLDYLLTGTFTRMASSIAIHGRIIDVVSGEIPATFSEQVVLTPDLAALFDEGQASAAAPPEADKPKADPCAALQAELQPLMEDMGTPEKLDRLVDAAIAVPWEKPCGLLHARIIAHLLRYKQRPPRYAAFLHKMLGTIPNPDEEERVQPMLRFLKGDGDLEPAVWRTAFGVLSRSAHFTGHLDTLLRRGDRGAPDLPRLLERTGTILEAVAQKKIGKPLPLAPGDVFTALFSEVQSLASAGGRMGDPAPVLAFYRTHGPTYATDGDKRLLSRMLDLVRSLPPGTNRAQALTWAAERLARFGDTAPIASDVCVFMDRLFDLRKEERKKGRWDGPAAQELDRIAALAGPRVATLIPHIQGREYRLNTQGFCLQYGFTAPGLPAESELIQQLEEGDRVAQAEALRLLTALGPKAKAAEPLVLKLLRRAESTRDWDSQVKYHVREVLDFLASHGTRDPEAHRLMIRHLGSLENVVSDGAMLALARLGGVVIPALQGAYGKQEHLVKMRMAEVFRTMGPAARPALPWLRARMEEKESSHLAIAFEDAIAKIERGK